MTTPLTPSEFDDGAGDVDHRAMLRQTINAFGKEAGALAEFLRQALENAKDGAATKINIIIEHGRQLMIANNGRGIMKPDVKRLNSLGMPRSPEEEHNYTGRNNTGRLSALALAGELNYYFRSQDYPKLRRLSLDFEKMAVLWDNKKKFNNPTEEITHVPKWWEDLLGNETGTVLRLEQVRWDRISEDAGKIRRQLMRILGPWMAEMVEMNGRALPEHYAGTRKFEDKGNETLGKFGPVKYKFYELPEDRRRREPGIRLGGINPLETLENFLDHVPELLADRVPTWMIQKRLTGFINSPEINRYANHDRNSVSPELYANAELVQAIIDMLVRLAAQLDEHYQLTARQFDRPDRIIDDVQRLISLFPSKDPPTPVGKKEGVDPKPEEHVRLGPGELEKIPGEEIVIRVMRGKGKGKWVFPDEMGEEQSQGPRHICIKLGQKLGNFRVTYHEPNDSHESGSMVVRVVEVKEPKIHGPFKEPAGIRLSFQIRGFDEGIATWSVDNMPLEMVLNPQSESVMIDVKRECPPSFYTLRAFAADGREVASRNFWVLPPDTRHMDICGDTFVVEDGIDNSKTFQFNERRRYQGGKKSTRGILSINLESTMAELHAKKYDRKSPAFDVFIAHQLADAYVQEFKHADRDTVLASILHNLPTT